MLVKLLLGVSTCSVCVYSMRRSQNLWVPPTQEGMLRGKEREKRNLWGSSGLGGISRIF